MSAKQALEMPTIPPDIDDTAVPLDLPESLGRRGALGLISRGGLAMVGGLAAVFASAAPAAADCQASPCCSLASCNKCSGSCHWTCPVVPLDLSVGLLPEVLVVRGWGAIHRLRRMPECQRCVRTYEIDEVVVLCLVG